jgi:RND family efflux transporter MFP subunit
MFRTHLSQASILAAAAVNSALAAGCEGVSEGRGGPSARAAPVARVEVVRPERQTVRRTVGQPGQLQAFETAEVHARVPGYVKVWTVNIGAAVKKGQVLAELSAPELEAELRQKQAAIEQAVARRKQAESLVEVAAADVPGSEAKLAEARAGINRADADVARWRSEFHRVEQLFAARAQTGSLLDETRNKLGASDATLAEVRAHVKTAEVGLVQAQAALDRARSDLAAAVAGIDVAEADARHARAMLDLTRIEAPFDGVVIQRNVDTGDLPRPGADGPPLFVVARSDIMTIAVDVPEAFATEVNPGDRASVKLQAMKGRVVEGTVSRISWALDPRTRTIRVEIDIANPGARLRPGLYAYATIIAEEHPDALTIPATAIVEESGKTRCVVVDASKAVRRPVELGLNDGTRAEVASGLSGGEVVVKANAASLADGQSVQVVEPEKTPAPGAKP